MLFIHNDVVAQLLTMRECIEAQEHAFRQVPSGGAIQRPRSKPSALIFIRPAIGRTK